MVRDGSARDLGIKVRRALDALCQLEFSTARKEFGELTKRYPANHAYGGALELTSHLEAAGDGLDDLTRAFFESARTVRRLRSADEDHEHAELPELCCRAAAQGLAERADRERGPEARVADVPLARLYVEARLPVPARACAEASLRGGGESAELLICLADAYALEEDARARAEARDLYRRALILDTHAVDLDKVVDLEVRDLLSLAELEYEVPGDPVEWLATVGYLERVLPIAHFDEAEFARLGEEGLLDVPLVPDGAKCFYHYMRVSESYHFFGARGDALRMEARKRLKAISPAMYSRYLKRF